MRTSLTKRADDYVRLAADVPGTTTTWVAPILPESSRVFFAYASQDVYAVAARRAAAPPETAFPARTVLGLSD